MCIIVEKIMLVKMGGVLGVEYMLMLKRFMLWLVVLWRSVMVLVKFMWL